MFRCYGAVMADVRLALTIGEDTMRAVKARAARTGKRDSEVIEDALRRQLALEVLDRLWARNRVPEEKAAQLSVEAQHATRPGRR